MSLSKLQEMVKDREMWHVSVHGVRESQTGLRPNNSITFNDFTHAILSILNRHVGLDTYSVITPKRLYINFFLFFNLFLLVGG